LYLFCYYQKPNDGCMKKSLLLILLCVLYVAKLSATTYYSVATGTFNTLTNWKTARDGTGSSPAAFNSAGDIFIVQGAIANGGGGAANHVMTVTGSSITFGAGGKVQIEGGGNMICSNSITTNATGTLQVDNGGTFTWNNTGGLANAFGGTESFAANSNFVMAAGLTTGPSTVSFGGSFGNFTQNGGATMQCSGLLPNIAGNLTVTSGTVRFCGSVAGNAGVTVGGNVLINGGTIDFGNGSVSGYNLTLLGNFTMTTGTLTHAITGGTSGSYVKGNIIFAKSGTATFTKSGGTITATASSFREINFTVNSGCTLDFGTSVLDALATTQVNFTLASGAGLITANAGGISAANAATGSIQNLTGARTFSTGANYTFNASSPQVTGSGLTGANNLTINNGNGVTISNDIAIAGDFTVAAGTVTPPTTITLTGSTGTQNIAGIAYNNLTINAAGAIKQLTSASSIAAGSTLTVTGGTLNLGSSLLTIKSNGSATARVAEILGSVDNSTGGFVQERFIPGKGSRTWSLVASPFTQTIASSWQLQVHITGAGTGGTVCPTLSSNSNGFDATVTNAASMFVYDGTKAVGSRWTSVTGTGINLTPGTGYRMNIRGPRSIECSLLDGSVSSTTAATLSTSGTLLNANKNLGSFSTTLLNNADASLANDNYLLTGNPYPSEISFSALQAANNTVIGTSYAIFAPGNTVGNYAFWNGLTFTGANTGTNDATGNIIANGQAFFVQGAAAGADIVLNWAENMKTTTANTGYFRQLNPNRLRIGYLLSNGSKADEIMVQFANNATSNTLNNEDVVSINTGTQHLKSLKAGIGLAFNTRSIHFTTDTVRLNVASTTNGNFKLSFYDFAQFVQATSAKIYLLDNYTHTVQLMNDVQDYPFTVNTSVPATYGTDRFAVVFSKPSPIAIFTPISSIKAYPNPVAKQLTVELPSLLNGSYSIVLTDIAGKQLSQQKAQGTVILATEALKAGTYLLTITNGEGEKQVQKIIKQ
jgi:hypothetical protein